MSTTPSPVLAAIPLAELLAEIQKRFDLQCWSARDARKVMLQALQEREAAVAELRKAQGGAA